MVIEIKDALDKLNATLNCELLDNAVPGEYINVTGDGNKKDDYKEWEFQYIRETTLAPWREYVIQNALTTKLGLTLGNDRHANNFIVRYHYTKKQWHVEYAAMFNLAGVTDDLRTNEGEWFDDIEDALKNAIDFLRFDLNAVVVPAEHAAFF